MSASIDGNISAPRVLAALWRPGAVFYLAVMLGALAAGLWPQAIYPPRQGPSASLPVLGVLAAAQQAFVLLVYPLILLYRSCGESSGGGYWGKTAGESAFLMFVAVPLYVLAAFFSDATATDAIRAALCVAASFPLAWVAGAHFASRRAGHWGVLLALTVAALGLPAAYYVALEFFPTGSADLPGTLSPILMAWRNGAARLGTLLPTPIWAWLLWPAVAGTWLLITLIFPHKGDGQA